MSNTTKSYADGTAQKGPSYPSTPQIKRVVGAFRSAGIQVGSVSIAPDGTIRVFDATTEVAREMDEFTRWERAGKL